MSISALAALRGDAAATALMHPLLFAIDGEVAHEMLGAIVKSKEGGSAT